MDQTAAANQPNTPDTDEPLRYACVTDTGRLRIGNEDAAYASPQSGVFVVSDGMGGLPAGAAASQIIVHALPHMVNRLACRLPDEERLTAHLMLSDVTNELSKKMYEQSLVCHGLRGMGATLVAMIIRGRSAHILHVGDSRAYLLRKGMLVPLTDDHSMVSKLLEHGKLVTEEFEERHQHLVTQHVAMNKPLDPSVRTIELKPGDRLLLCSDGLSGPVDNTTIGKALFHNDDPQTTCHKLIETANEHGGPDNITAMVIHWLGGRINHADAEPPAQPLAELPVPATVQKMQTPLLDLEKDLQWLHDAARQAAQPNTASALETVEQLLGEQHYAEYMQNNPDAPPAQVLHQVCTAADSRWRSDYDAHMQTLDPLFQEVTNGNVDLCPLIPNEQTALILRTLWNEYRQVEQRYLATYDRMPVPADQRSLEYLIEQLLEGVRTMIGLLEFLPKFVC